LWASDVHSSDRRSAFKALNDKIKDLLTKSEQSLRGDKTRKNFTWIESFTEWVEYGRLHPHRKNRIPIDEGRLSTWVHEQRKAFKRNKLADDRRTLLQNEGFIFDARFAYAPYLQGYGPSTLLNPVSQSGFLVSQLELSQAQGSTNETQVGHSVSQPVVFVPQLGSIDSHWFTGQSDPEQPMILSSFSQPVTSVSLLASTDAKQTTHLKSDFSSDTLQLDAPSLSGKETLTVLHVNKNVSSEAEDSAILIDTSATVEAEDGAILTNNAATSEAEDGAIEMKIESMSDRILRHRKLPTTGVVGRAKQVKKGRKLRKDVVLTQDTLAHVFQFDHSMSGKQKLASLLGCEYTDPKSQFHLFVAFHVDDSNEILYSDVWKFKKKLFIPSGVINAFFSLLDSSFQEGKGGNRFGHSFIYSQYICDKSYPLSKLKKLLHVGSCKNFYFPINVNNNHWILAAINWESRTIHIYDPLDSTYPVEVMILCNRVNALLGDAQKVVVNNHEKEKIQRQSDCHSCAFFLCWYAFQLSAGRSISVWLDKEWCSETELISESVFISLIEKKIAF
jgi:hypothetical protein